MWGDKMKEKKEENVDLASTTPIQFYISKEMKKRLKTYCAVSDEKMTGVLTHVLDVFLKSKGF